MVDTSSLQTEDHSLMKCSVCGREVSFKIAFWRHHTLKEPLCLACEVWSHHEIAYIALKNSTIGGHLLRIKVES